MWVQATTDKMYIYFHLSKNLKKTALFSNMQRFTVTVKTKKPQSLVEVVDQSHLIISVKSPPIDGRANAAVIIALAVHFNLSPNRINIISGHTSKVKIIEIDD